MADGGLHLLIIDANLPGIDTIGVAKDRGMRVSFIRSAYRKYPETDAVRACVYRADAVLTVEHSTDEEEIFAVAQVLHQLWPIAAVVTLLDPCTEVAARVCARLGLRFTAAAAVALARDKFRMAQHLRARGLRMPRLALVTTRRQAQAAAAAMPGPVVIKPRKGYDSLLASVAATPAQAAAQVGRFAAAIRMQPRAMRADLRAGIVVEEWLEGPLLSAEMAVRDGRCYPLMLSEQPRARENPCLLVGAAMPADLPRDTCQQCLAYAETVIRALGLDFGIFHIEMILTPTGPVLIDANPRAMGGIMPALYHLATRRDLHDLLLDLHCGLPLPEFPAMTSGYVAARHLLPRQDGALPAVFDMSWLEQYQPYLVRLEDYALHPGARVRRAQVLATLLVRGSNAKAAATLADLMVARCSEALQIPLSQSA